MNNAKKSLFLFSNDNPVRNACKKIVDNDWFTNLIIFCIAVSTVQLALENPLLNPEGLLFKVLFYIDLALSSVFIFECTLKIISLGFLFCGPDSYLRSTWNFLDFSIVVFSFFPLIVRDSELSFLRVAKLLRILRPLRVVSTNPNLKLLI